MPNPPLNLKTRLQPNQLTLKPTGQFRTMSQWCECPHDASDVHSHDASRHYDHHDQRRPHPRGRREAGAQAVAATPTAATSAAAAPHVAAASASAEHQARWVPHWTQTHFQSNTNPIPIQK